MVKIKTMTYYFLFILILFTYFLYSDKTGILEQKRFKSVKILNWSLIVFFWIIFFTFIIK